MPAPTVRLFTRKGCCLCDDAYAELEKLSGSLGFRVETVDIDSAPEITPELRQSLEIFIPIIKVNGQEVSRYRVDREALKKALRQTQMTEPQTPPETGKPAADAPGAEESPSIRGFLIVLGLAVLAVAIAFVRFPAQGNVKFPGVGDTAPVFQGKLLTGEDFSLEAERGRRVIILNFWASWCDPCIREMPDLEKLYRRTKASGVELIAVNEDSREAVVRDFTQRKGITLPVIWDQDERIGKKYGTFRFPETYVIDLDGKIVKKIYGPADWASDEVASFVQELAAKGGHVEGEADPLKGGSREQLSDRTHDLRNSPN